MRGFGAAILLLRLITQGSAAESAQKVVGVQRFLITTAFVTSSFVFPWAFSRRIYSVGKAGIHFGDGYRLSPV
jgi:hypothetical protein